MEILLDGINANNCSNEQIVEAFKLLKKAYHKNRHNKLQEIANQFLPGHIVKFYSKKKRKYVIGKITKINKTTVDLVEYENPLHRWKVAITLIEFAG